MRILNNYNKNQGFTLLEILISLAIIGIIISGIAVSAIHVRKKARDEERKTEIQTIAQNLVMYRNDKGNYPTALASLSVAGYLKTVPTDADGSSYSYIQTGSGSGFDMSVSLETQGEAYKVSNP